MYRTIKKAKQHLTDISGVITVRDAGRRGGRTTLEKHGAEFFKKIGKIGGERTAQLHCDLMREYGKKGGRPRRPALDAYMGEETGN